MRCFAAILAGLVAGAAIAGCGGDGGVQSGATVSVYVDAGLCPEAREVLAGESGPPRDVRVRVVCVARTGRAGRLDLAAVGAGARRAAEDSTAVAFVEEPDPRANRFAHPILESAGIGWVESGSGSAATRRVLGAIEDAGSGSLRDEVREALE